MIELKPVHTFPNEVAFPFLYELLKERDDTVNVHHQELPSYEAHVAFCLRHGMTGQWWIVMAGNEMAGMVSCTGGKGGSDVGVFILKKFQGKGYGEAAMRAMMALRDPHQKHLAELRERAIAEDRDVLPELLTTDEIRDSYLMVFLGVADPAGHG